MRGTSVFFVATLLGASVLFVESHARAQVREAPSLDRPLASPSHALELEVGTGYTQGFGSLTPSQGIRDVAGPGIGASVGVGYRFDPRFSIGLQGEYQAFAPNTLAYAGARGIAGNLGFTFHGRPFVTGDPWLRVASGYRMLWSVNPVNGGPTTMVHGFEVAKAALGYDFRFSPGVAIAPVVGVDLDLWEWQVQSGVNSALSSSQVGTYVFVGLQGRFDVGKMEEPHATIAGR